MQGIGFGLYFLPKAEIVVFLPDSLNSLGSSSHLLSFKNIFNNLQSNERYDWQFLFWFHMLCKKAVKIRTASFFGSII